MELHHSDLIKLREDSTDNVPSNFVYIGYCMDALCRGIHNNERYFEGVFRSGTDAFDYHLRKEVVLPPEFVAEQCDQLVERASETVRSARFLSLPSHAQDAELRDALFLQHEEVYGQLIVFNNNAKEKDDKRKRLGEVLNQGQDNKKVRNNAGIPKSNRVCLPYLLNKSGILTRKKVKFGACSKGVNACLYSRGDVSKFKASEVLDNIKNFYKSLDPSVWSNVETMCKTRARIKTYLFILT